MAPTNNWEINPLNGTSVFFSISNCDYTILQISPNIMMKGSDHKKSLLLNYYDDSKKQENE